MTATPAAAPASPASLAGLQDLLAFPFRQPRWREKLLLAALFTLSGFFIPIVPPLLVLGYCAAIARRAIAEGELHLPEWTEWNGLLRDGLQVFGAGLLYALPATGLTTLGLALAIVVPALSPIIALVGDGTDLPWLWVAFGLALVGVVFVVPGLLLSLVTGLVAPPALMHLIATGDFAAAFRYREWWPILRANLAGFVWAYVVVWGGAFLVSFTLWILCLTLILCCLVPFVMLGFSAYYNAVYYSAFALAYREGKEMLAHFASAEDK